MRKVFLTSPQLIRSTGPRGVPCLDRSGGREKGFPRPTRGATTLGATMNPPHRSSTGRRRALTLFTAGAVGAALVISGQTATAAPASATLVVSAGQVLRPVTHVATGSLYGLADAT